MSFKPVEYIRSHSREEWLGLAKEKWIDARIFVQENGELSLVLGFAVGLVFVLFFRFFLGILVVFSFLAIAVWNIAESGKTITIVSPPPSDDSDSTNTDHKIN